MIPQDQNRENTKILQDLNIEENWHIKQVLESEVLLPN